jgi:chromosome condensin MukBEF MukE localization factor
LILEIKRLLYAERLTIAGARKKIVENGNRRASDEDVDRIRIIREVKEDLRSFRDLL